MILRVTQATNRLSSRFITGFSQRKFKLFSKIKKFKKKSLNSFSFDTHYVEVLNYKILQFSKNTLLPKTYFVDWFVVITLLVILLNV